MASYTYTQTIDTLTTAAIDEATKDLANLVNEGGEKVLKKMQSKGRIFVVNDAEKVKHPVLYGSGSTLLFDPDTFAGASGTGISGHAAEEIMSFAQFHMSAGTRNINYPQAMPAGNHIPYISNAIKMHMMDILNLEEKQFLVGNADGSTHAIVGAFVGDGGYDATLPTNLIGIVDTTASSRFAGIAWDDEATLAHWKAGTAVATADSPDEMSEWGPTLDAAILDCSYSETERPDWFLTTQAVYKNLLTALRAKSQINDAVLANLGTTTEVPYAGVTVDWSRYLVKDALWNVGAGTAAFNPLVGINTNSLRLNVVAGGGVSDGKLGFVQKVGSTQTHAAATQLFDRGQYKRCWSLDGGRRSFVQVEGITT